MKQRDALEIFSFKNYYGAHTTTVLLNASNSVKYAVKTASIVKQHKRVETLLELDSIDDLNSTEGRLVHLRDSEVVLFKVARSNYWQARFRIYTGKWIRFSTRRRNLDDARQIACDKYDEARYRERLGFTALVKRFDEMAKCCVTEMRRDIAAGTGKKIYTAYIAVIETYLIPFFGQMYLTSITNKHIAEFEVWRNSQLRRPPKVSTLLTFATAFTRITKTAVEQGWISDKVPVPKLNVRGEKGQARPAFTNDEVAQVLDFQKIMQIFVRMGC